MLRFYFFIFMLAFNVMTPNLANAQKRVALVVGNSQYVHAPTLANPKNDAQDISAVLKSFGFEVLEGYDLDKPGFDRKSREFADNLPGASAAIFFYAGHGLQVAGRNFLVPVDAKLETLSALDFEAIPLDLIHRSMERSTTTNVIFVDACRNNPLTRNLARAMGTRSTDIGRGLAQIDAGAGTLISFSTQPGNVALDGTGRNSPFSNALVKQLRASTDDLSAILIGVRKDVMAATNGAQVPWEHSALTGRFYFGEAPIGAGEPAPTGSASEWARVDKSSAAEIRTFLQRNANSVEAQYAKARLEDMTGRQSDRTPSTSETPKKIAKLNFGPPAGPASESKRVNAFTYLTHPQEIDPGLRRFKRSSDGTWTNTYPSGFVEQGKEQARIRLDRCTGAVIDKETEGGFYVFIPDKGCPGMMLRFKRGGAGWVVFGQMNNVQ